MNSIMKVFCYMWSYPSPVYQGSNYSVALIPAPTQEQADIIFKTLGIYNQDLSSNFTVTEIDLVAGGAIEIKEEAVVYHLPKVSIKKDELWQCIACQTANDNKALKCKACGQPKPE